MELCSVRDLESYPEEWLQNFISLLKLKIYNCEELASLPWIANLTSLQQLSIQGCLNLTSLPQGIRNITSLKQLTIKNCPILWRRCLRPIGEDWPIISHVPCVIVEYENQQEETNSPEIEWFLKHVERT
uniref:CC-NBS-LRR protein n=1 Tax=Quercus lobata TaxID=97700 RepID=A0A7N2N6B7_QUELO